MNARAQMMKVVKGHSKSDPRYLKTHAADESTIGDTEAFVLVEQIDVGVHDGQYRWSVWLMKPGEAEFSRVYEDHAYETQRELCIRLTDKEGKLSAFNENGDIVWSHDPDGKMATA